MSSYKVRKGKAKSAAVEVTLNNPVIASKFEEGGRTHLSLFLSGEEAVKLAALGRHSNSREPTINKVVKDQRRGLENRPDLFLSKNQGAVVFVSKIIEKRNGDICLQGSDPGPFGVGNTGITNGSHSILTLEEAMEEGLDLSEVFINVRVIQGIKSEERAEICEALNTSAKQNRRGMVTQADKWWPLFDELPEGVAEKIAWRPGEKDKSKKLQPERILAYHNAFKHLPPDDVTGLPENGAVLTKGKDVILLEYQMDNKSGWDLSLTKSLLEMEREIAEEICKVQSELPDQDRVFKGAKPHLFLGDKANYAVPTGMILAVMKAAGQVWLQWEDVDASEIPVREATRWLTERKLNPPDGEEKRYTGTNIVRDPSIIKDLVEVIEAEL